MKGKKALTDNRDDRAGSVEHGGITYEWLGQSTVRMTTSGGFVIYTDPVLLDGSPAKADLVVITHHHVDHCLPEFVSAIRKDDTAMAAFHDSYVKHCAEDIKGVKTVRIGQTVELRGVGITGVEAYTDRGFHIRGEGCGFVLEVEGQLVYFAGDTSRTSEMASLGPVDVAILPIADNEYRISPEEMAGAARELSPGLLIPVHFTPPDEPDPVPREGMFSVKDPRYFTRRVDPAGLAPLLKGTGTEVALLRKLVPPADEE